MDIKFSLGEFRDKRDETPLTKKQLIKAGKESKAMHAHIDYKVEIAFLDERLKNAKSKDDKAMYFSLLCSAKQQQKAGYGKK